MDESFSRCRLLGVITLVVAISDISGCAAQGSTVADNIFGVNRPALDLYVQKSQQDNALWAARMQDLQAQKELREAQQKSEARTVEARQFLESAWNSLGLAPEQARAVAAAYQPSANDSNILAGVRARGSDSAVEPMADAVKRYDFLLADQLLLAATIVRQEEQASAASRTPETTSPRVQQK